MIVSSVLLLATLAHANQPAKTSGSVDATGEERAWPEAPGELEDALELPPKGQGHGVVGGQQVPEGKWDDTVGVIFFDAFVGCTGTLVGPRVVLTAAHCVQGVDVTSVLIGSKDYTSGEGEILEVEEVFEYPDSQRSYDIAVLTLTESSTFKPRAIGLECILQDYLRDGARAQVVGYGSTSEFGGGGNTLLNETVTTILDRNCDEAEIEDVLLGCQPSVSPGGEIAAGSDGGDACFGDSGGPLYLKTERGPYVVGVTSRGFIGLAFAGLPPCGYGGIWVRPDAVIDWIEDVVGRKKLQYPTCNEAPQVFVDALATREGKGIGTLGAAFDPDGDTAALVWSIAQAPENGTATVSGGRIRELCARRWVCGRRCVHGGRYRRRQPPVQAHWGARDHRARRSRRGCGAGLFRLCHQRSSGNAPVGSVAAAAVGVAPPLLRRGGERAGVDGAIL